MTSIIVNDVHGMPVAMQLQSRGSRFEGIYFSAHTQLSKRQLKRQPTLLMTINDWNDVRRHNVTHAGAFGSDYHVIGVDKMKKRMVHFPEWGEIDWVVVWKFPGDLNYIYDSQGRHAFQKILNVPLPVGYYSLDDDGWFSRRHEHHALPKGTAMEKMRTEFEPGPSAHHLSSTEDLKVAMLGSNYFFADFDDPRSSERKTLNDCLHALYDECGLYAFPCNGSHHAIVFYMDRRRQNELITPERMAAILEDENRGVLKVMRRYVRKGMGIDAWSRNFIALNRMSSTLLQSPAPTTKEATQMRPMTHNNPYDATGTLVRQEPIANNNYISETPIPNKVTVNVVSSGDPFSLVHYKSLQGWVRTRYLSNPTTSSTSGSSPLGSKKTQAKKKPGDCVGKAPSDCNPPCKWVSGKQRSYCRRA